MNVTAMFFPSSILRRSIGERMKRAHSAFFKSKLITRKTREDKKHVKHAARRKQSGTVGQKTSGLRATSLAASILCELTRRMKIRINGISAIIRTCALRIA